MEIYDLLLDDDLDLSLADGDFATGEATKQSQTLLLLTNKGEWKQHPQRGVGVVGYLETGDMSALAREVRSDFTADGMRVENVRVVGTNLNVEAWYE